MTTQPHIPRATLQRAFADDAAVRAEIVVTELQISKAKSKLDELTGTEAVLWQRRIDGLELWRTWLTEYLAGNTTVTTAQEMGL